MSRFSRRQFVTHASMAGAVALAPRVVRSEPADGATALAEPAPIEVTSGADIVTLGSTDIKTSVLGIGTGTRGGREQLGLGQRGFIDMMKYAYDCGIRYIDTADMYRTHLFTGFTLKELPGDDVFVQTKTRAKHPEVAKADLERFRKEMGVQTLDTVLMHCMTADEWHTELRPVLDVLLDAKEKGRIRAVGVSCHTLDALHDAVSCPDIDVHLVRINPKGVKMDGQPEQVVPYIREMHRKGRGVIGMKIFGEGAFQTAEERLESLKFVLGLGCVHCFTIGFSSTAQIDETLAMIQKATA